MHNKARNSYVCLGGGNPEQIFNAFDAQFTPSTFISTPDQGFFISDNIPSKND